MEILDDPGRELVLSDAVWLEVMPKPTYHGQHDEVQFYEEIFAAADRQGWDIGVLSMAHDLAVRYGIAAWASAWGPRSANSRKCFRSRTPSALLRDRSICSGLRLENTRSSRRARVTATFLPGSRHAARVFGAAPQISDCVTSASVRPARGGRGQSGGGDTRPTRCLVQASRTNQRARSPSEPRRALERLATDGEAGARLERRGRARGEPGPSVQSTEEGRRTPRHGWRGWRPIQATQLRQGWLFRGGHIEQRVGLPGPSLGPALRARCARGRSLQAIASSPRGFSPTLSTCRRPHAGAFGMLAERVGFEPTEGRPSTVFKTAAFGRSATSPAVVSLGRPAPAIPGQNN